MCQTQGVQRKVLPSNTPVLLGGHPSVTAILRRRISTKLAEWMKCVVISAAVSLYVKLFEPASQGKLVGQACQGKLVRAS